MVLEMQRQSVEMRDIPLRKLLSILYNAREPLEFIKIHQEVGLTRPCLSRHLREGEKLGLIEKIIEENATTHRQKLSWVITQRGKRVQRLYESAQEIE